jgi:CubicO group peptidase (beta-lactamase class C family)
LRGNQPASAAAAGGPARWSRGYNPATVQHTRTLFRHAACVVTSLVLFTSGAATQEAATCRDARFRDALRTAREALVKEGLPSISLAVAERGRITCEAAFGWADRSGQVPATPSTMYSLASISKPFTATAVMGLVERGVLDLERPANDYLDAAKLRAFEGRAEDATLSRLLTHTAGLPLHYQFFYAGGPAVPAMDAAIAKYGIIVYPPGERYFYSNFGYGVVERVLERAGGRPYADVLRQTVLDPLGLAETMVSDGAGLDGRRAAFRYDGDGEPVRPYTFDHVAASGVWSSARDLIRFGLFHLGHDPEGRAPALSRETRRLMQRDHVPSDGPGRTRGLGWGIVSDTGGWRQVAHTGSMPGVATILSLYPDADVAIVVLTNASNSRAVGQIERALASAALPRPRVTSGVQRAASPGGGAAPAVALRMADADLVETLGGRWSGWAHIAGERIPLDLEVRGSDDVRVRVRNGEAVVLEGLRWSDNWLTGRATATLAPPDAAPGDDSAGHRAMFNLARRGDRLLGWATALSTATPTYGAVSFAVELTKEAGTAIGKTSARR